MRKVVPFIFTLISLLAACIPDLEPPNNARIRCTISDDCPPTWQCGATSLCIPPDRDTDGPAGTLQVDDAAVEAGGDVVVTLSVDEDVVDFPELRLVWGLSERVITTLPVHDADSLNYTYTYAANGTEETDSAASIVATFVDADGNTGEAQLVNAVRFDREPPTLAGAVALSVEQPRETFVAEPSLGSDATVSLTFVASEELGAATTVRSNVDPTVQLTLVGSVGLSYTYEYTVPTGLVDPGTDHPLVLEALDVAGNPASIPLVTVRFDSEAPAQPDVDTGTPEPRIRYTRRPWGFEGLRSPEDFTLSGAAGAVEADATVLVSTGMDADSSVRLAQSSAGPDGGFGTVRLPQEDRAEIFVVAVDASGNRSPVRRVRHVTWLATVLDRLSGADAINPHRLEIQPEVPSSSWSRTSLEPAVGDAPNAYAPDGVGVVATGVRRWRLRAGGFITIGILGSHVFDSRRGEGLLMGGIGQTSPSSSVPMTVWDGESVFQLSENLPGPGGRTSMAVAYDTARERVVAFGGADSSLSLLFEGTWEWDGERWHDMTPAGLSPQPRYAAAMVYVPETGRSILLGGVDVNGTALDEQWEWDGAAWEQNTTGPLPPARGGHAIAHHPQTGEVFLFGGCAQFPAQFGCAAGLNDTWILSDGAWELASQTGAARMFHGLAYSAHDDAMLLALGASSDTSATDCGGEGNGATCEAVKIWRGGAWVEDTSAPRLTGFGPFARVPWDGTLTAFGAVQNLAGILAYRDGAWAVTASFSPDEPSQMTGMGSAFDPSLGQMITFGGIADGRCTNSVDNECDEMWFWDGAGWTARDLPGDPVGRYNIAMTYHPALQAVVFFGGRDAGAATAELWSYDARADSYTLLCDPAGGCASPTPREHPNLFYDTVTSELIMFGGVQNIVGATCPDGSPSFNINGPDQCYYDDVWSWDRVGGWIQLCGNGTACAGPPRRARAAVAYDSSRGVAVLYGGETADPAAPGTVADSSGYRRFVDTWEWSAGAWMNACAQPGCVNPGPRAGAAMAADPNRARAYLFGGQNADTVLWAWDGETWLQRARFGPGPARRYGHTAVFDSLRDRLIIFSGFVRAPDSDVWEIDMGSDYRGSAKFVVDWAAAGAPRDNLTSVAVRAVMGGRGYSTDTSTVDDPDFVGDPLAGATMRVWDRALQTWRSVGTTTADTAAPEAVLATLNDPMNLVGGADDTLRVQFEANLGSGNGPGEAEVVVDYIEAQLSYTLDP